MCRRDNPCSRVRSRSRTGWAICRWGRSARVFLGVVPGWQAQRQSAPSVEQIAEHWAEISDMTHGFAAPMSATEEHGIVLAQDTAGA